MCVVDLRDATAFDPEELLLDNELLAFVDEVDTADPQLLTLGDDAGDDRAHRSIGDGPRPYSLVPPSPSSMGVSLVFPTNGANTPLVDNFAPVTLASPSFSRFSDEDSGCTSADSRSTTSSPERGDDGEPQSFATVPVWLVPDHVAFDACMETIVAEYESEDENGVLPVDGVAYKRRRAESYQSSAAGESPLLTAADVRHYGQEVQQSPPPAQAGVASSSAVVVSPKDKTGERSRRRRKRQKEEVLQLRDRIAELENDLDHLKRREIAASEEAREKAIVFNVVPMPRLLAHGSRSNRAPMKEIHEEIDENAVELTDKAKGTLSRSALWERIAGHHKEELRKSKFENVRLRALAEQQLRVLKKLEIEFGSSGKPRRVIARPGRSERLLSRGLFPSEAAIFDSLRAHLSAQYMETDRIYRASGLTSFDGDMAQTAVPHTVNSRGAIGGIGTEAIYLENAECKVFPFSIRAVDEAIWRFLAREDSEYHPGYYQVYEATDDVVTIKVSDTVHLSQAETLVTVWMTCRRYEEDDRIVTVWSSMVEMEGAVNMHLHERGWNILRSLLTNPSPSMCVTQTLMRVSPVTNTSFSLDDVAVGSLGNLLIGCYHRTVVVMHHMLEKLLLTELKTLTHK